MMVDLQSEKTPDVQKSTIIQCLVALVFALLGLWLVIGGPMVVSGANAGGVKITQLSDTSRPEYVTFGGVIFMSLGITLLISYFENIDASIAGPIKFLGDKLGAFVGGFVLFFLLVTAGLLACVFWIVEPKVADRTSYTALKERYEELTKQNVDLFGELDKFLENADPEDIEKGIKRALTQHREQDQPLRDALEHYFTGSGLPLIIKLQCPDLGNQIGPGYTLISNQDPSSYDIGLFVNPDDPNADPVGPIIVRGEMRHNLTLYSEARPIDENRILILEITRSVENDGAVVAQIILKKPDKFSEICDRRRIEGPDATTDSEGEQPVTVPPKTPPKQDGP